MGPVLLGVVIEGDEVLPIPLQAVSRIAVTGGQELGTVPSPSAAAFGQGGGLVDLLDCSLGFRVEPLEELVDNIQTPALLMPPSGLTAAWPTSLPHTHPIVFA